jgi:hypothetical protein
MRAFLCQFFVVSIALLLSSRSESQSVSVTAEPRVYFLIDSSGSMADEHAELQGSVSRELEATRSSAPDSEIFATFFGADNRDECAAPITIGPQVSSDQEIIVPNVGYKRSTPIGSAVQAAIKHAGEREAKIYVFTDEAQTQSCGTDVCAVAA